MLVAEFDIPYLETDTANQYIRGMQEISSFISGQARLAAYNENEGDISAVMIGESNQSGCKIYLYAAHKETNALGMDYTVTTQKIGEKKLNCDKVISDDYYWSHLTGSYVYCTTKSHLNQSGFSKILSQALKKGVTNKDQQYSDLRLKVEKDGYTSSNNYLDQLCLSSKDYSSVVAFRPEEDKLTVSLYAEPRTSDSDAKLIMSALEFAELNDFDVTYHNDGLEKAFDEHFPATFRYGTHKTVEKTKSWFSSTAGKLTGWLRK